MSYGQVRLEVPENWPVTAAPDDLDYFDPFRTPPKVYEGASKSSVASIPPQSQLNMPADGVWIAPGDQTGILPTPRHSAARFGGLSVTYAVNPFTYQDVMMLVGSGPSLTTVIIGVGVNPATAEQIIDSVNIQPTSPS